MSLTELMNKLSEEAVFLEPGKIASCGKMLAILEDIDHPSVEKEKQNLKSLLESMIMKDLEGSDVTVEQIVEAVEDIQNVLRNPELGVDSADAGEVSKAEPSDSDDDVDIPFDDDENGDSPEAEDTSSKPEPEPAPAPEPEPEPEPEAVAAPAPSPLDSNEPEPLDDMELVADFISEAREHLDSIELNMVEWERSPDDKEIINSIFRPFHTIKGVAGFLNLKKINHLSHQLENVLDEARDGKILLTPELSDLIFDGVDVLKSMTDTLEAALNAGSDTVTFSANAATLEQKIDMVMNSSRVTAADEPVAEKSAPIGEILVKDGKIKEEDLSDVLVKQQTAEAKKPVGEMLIDEHKVTPRDVRDAIRKQTESVKIKIEKYIKVDTHKMDQLLNMVGELVIAQSMVTHNPDVEDITSQRFIRDISQLTRVTTTLQNISMSMRLVPIGQTFQKMNRIVRDLSRKAGKQINLVLQGESAEIDRNMVEELYDPLVHMIRNSCDHGIQTPDKRKEKGKPGDGTITLKAEHAGGKIVITIADDGEGLDRERILQIARDKGVWTEAEPPDNKTIDNFIFAAGFSTAKKITDVSGRGVGMDVVRKAIEKLHGTVDTNSNPGKGTTFTIKLPLTTAIIDGMLVMVGTERYILPTLSVRQLVHAKKEDITSVIGKGETLSVRGRLLPVVKLYNFLNIDSKSESSWDGVMVIVEDAGREIALQVDEVIGKQEVVIKSLDERFTTKNGVAGGAILGDGRVGLILDIRTIFDTRLNGENILVEGV